jgi:hypothetical protein
MTCMINGLEDLYEHQTGTRLPDWLLFYLSGMVGFVYLKNKNAPAPRMVFWGAQIAKYQYEELAGVVGFRWEMVAGRSFPFTLKRAKQAIDQGNPALLGALDMYHLPYYDKFYHMYHIPIHHVLMVGYDDEREAILVLDCDRADLQLVPYTDLEPAWNVNVPGLGKKNTFYTFYFDDQVADVETIARKGLAKRATEMLEAPVSMLGIKGMRKLARELAQWPEELTSNQLECSLRHLAEFTGFPPMPPNRLTGYHDASDNHGGGRDIFAGLLRRMAADCTEPAWTEAANLFDQSSRTLEEMTDIIVDFLLGERDYLNPASTAIMAIADLEEQAFELIAGA